MNQLQIFVQTKRLTSYLCSSLFHSNIGKSVTQRIECADWHKETENLKGDIRSMTKAETELLLVSRQYAMITCTEYVDYTRT